jgi:hypothetical protein
MLGGEQRMRWYINQSGKTDGPFSEERIAMLAAWGKISRDAYICDEQFSTWVSIARSAFGPLVTGTESAEDSAEANSEPAPAESRRAGQNLRAWLTGAVLLAGALVLALSAT